MRRLFVSINDAAFDELHRTACDARRRPADQAGVILERALQSGLLTAKDDNSDDRDSEIEAVGTIS